jgi:hypothetical protein
MDPNHSAADDERPGRPPEPVTAVINGDQVMFLDCPAYLDQDGALRCGLPAEVRYRFTMRSSDGPLEAAMIRCPSGHYFCAAIESLTWDGKDEHDPGPAGLGSRAGRDNLQRGHDGRHGGGGPAVRDVPAGPERTGHRPSTAPAYYLGHPARLWITVMRPRRRREPPADAPYPAGQDQPPNPARAAQPGRSRVLGQIVNPAPASASREDTS